jgi:hypothetical protein
MSDSGWLRPHQADPERAGGVVKRSVAVKLAHAALLALAIATPQLVAAEIDASQADARLIGMPIFTSDGLLFGQVTNIEITSSCY